MAEALHTGPSSLTLSSAWHKALTAQAIAGLVKGQAIRGQPIWGQPIWGQPRHGQVTAPPFQETAPLLWSLALIFGLPLAAGFAAVNATACRCNRTAAGLAGKRRSRV